MKFIGVRGCKPNQVVRFWYQERLTDEQAQKIRRVVQGIFAADADVDTFCITADGASNINGIKFEAKCIDIAVLQTFLEQNYDVRTLHICSVALNGRVLTVDTYNRKQYIRMEVLADAEAKTKSTCSVNGGRTTTNQGTIGTENRLC